MRIGVNCCFLVEHGGGIGQYFARLMNRLLAAPADEYVLFHLAENVKSLDEMLVPAWRTHAVQVALQRDIGRLLASVDLYFCPAGKLFPRPAPLASVVTLVDVQEAYFPQFFTWRDRWFRFYHHPSSTRLATRVITISEFSRRSIAELHDIPLSKIDVAYPAPDDDLRPAADAPASLPPGLPERFLLYPANFWLHKNHDRLLQALALARDQSGLVMPCVLTGAEKPNGYDIRAGITKHRLEGQVHFIGHRSAADMQALYKCATALVFASLFEGFGLPVAEAMAAGCPVACSNTTSVPEVAGDAAAYFSPDDPTDIARQLMAVWTDARLRADLIQKGRTRAQRFSAAAMVAAHQQSFAAAIEDFQRRGPQAYPRHLDWRDLLVAAWQSIRWRNG